MTRLIICSVLFSVLIGGQSLQAEPARNLAPPAYDVAVYGATPGGIALAVRVARDGRSVVMIGSSPRLGGILSQGLGAIDSLYHGPRAPLFDEWIASIHHYYRVRHGADSPQFKSSRPHEANVRVESHVAERLFNELVAREPRITLRCGFYPTAATRDGALLREVTFRAMPGHGDAGFTVSAKVFADCSYEGDLAAIAGVPYRVARESRAEFGEEHAGRIFVREVAWPPPGVAPAYLAAYQKLNIKHSNRWSEIIYPQSTGAADTAVQAYSIRLLLSNDTANFVPIRRPADYDRDAFSTQLDRSMYWRPGIPKNDIPNGKFFILQPEIIGRQNAYIEGNWDERRRVVDDHRSATLKLLHFYQTDARFPQATRDAWSKIGLPRDEFPESGHLPDEIYVREARRIIGRSIVTEHNLRLAAGNGRAPVVTDSIGIAEWYLDSHACTPERVGDSLWEGEFYLYNKTWPGQVSLGSILPRGTDNLLVPVALSATHVAFGSVRVEPVWMSLGEAAGHLAVAALEKKIAPSAMPADALVRRLAEQRFLLSFFNDIAAHRDADWYPAVQYLGTKGFFGSYDARAAEPLTEALAAIWLDAAAKLRNGTAYDASALARECLAVEDAPGNAVTPQAFLRRMERNQNAALTKTTAPAQPLTRGAACRLIFESLQNQDSRRIVPSRHQGTSS